jgi:UDP-GlcNAc:undecaprenyl-phosphate GlcNAc-1-phosphate transferase
MHLHHRLLQIGHSHRRVVLVIYLWVGVLAFGAVGSSLIDRRIVVLLVAAGLVFALVVTAVPSIRMDAAVQRRRAKKSGRRGRRS